MSLIVQVKVNFTTILEGWAQRLKPMNPNRDSICTYRLHNGRIIRHRYGDGAKKLALRILREIPPHNDGPEHYCPDCKRKP